jgi:hypothetical protein
MSSSSTVCHLGEVVVVAACEEGTAGRARTKR